MHAIITRLSRADMREETSLWRARASVRERSLGSGSGLGKRRVGHLSKFCGTPDRPPESFLGLFLGSRKTKPTPGGLLGERECNVGEPQLRSKKHTTHGRNSHGGSLADLRSGLGRPTA